MYVLKHWLFQWKIPEIAIARESMRLKLTRSDDFSEDAELHLRSNIKDMSFQQNLTILHCSSKCVSWLVWSRHCPHPCGESTCPSSPRTHCPQCCQGPAACQSSCAPCSLFRTRWRTWWHSPGRRTWSGCHWSLRKSPPRPCPRSSSSSSGDLSHNKLIKRRKQREKR